MNDQSKAGFGKARVEIAASLPIREFGAIESDLYVRSLILENQQRYVVISFEMTSLTPRDLKKFKEIAKDVTKVTEDRISITVTHTFSAPHLKNELRTQEDQETYDQFFNNLKEALIKSLAGALKDLTAVRLGYTKVACPLNVNRNVLTDKGWWIGRSLIGYTNHDLRLIVLKKENDHEIVLFNYDMQPSVMDHIDNDESIRVISADLYGKAAKMLETENLIDGVIPTVGCAGDQRPLFTGKDEPSYNYALNVLEAQTKLLAECITEGLSQEMSWQDFTIQALKVETKLPGQKMQYGTFDLKPTKTYTFIPDQDVDISVEALVLNDLVIAGTQPEMNSRFGDRCAQQLDKECVIMTLWNGGLKYLPEAEDFEKITYQSMNTRIGQGADEALLKSFAELNEKIKGEEQCG